MKQLFKKSRGISLVELVVSISVFTLVTASVAMFSIDAFRSNENSRKRIEAANYLQEVNNALLAIKSDNWSSIINNTGGNKKIVFQNNKYSLASGTNLQNDFTINIVVGSVYRDSNSNIVTSGGTLDSRSRSLTTTISWTDFLNVAQSTSSTIYINDWNTNSWLQTTQSDFNAGTHNGTKTTNTSGGEVTLNTVVYADWCNPALTLSAYNLPGQGIAQAITAITGQAFVGTGANASGISFANVLIDDNDPPNVSTPGTFDGYKTNAVFGESGYAYIATDTNSEEIVIISLASLPYTKVGTFNAPGNGSGNAIFVANNKGYMASNNKFYVFDLSSKTGSRSQIGSSVNLAGTATQVKVIGNYAYVSINSSNTQLQIIDVSNPASSMSVVATASLNGLGAKDVYVNPNGNRAYVVTGVSSTLKELFIVNTSTKSGSLSTISSYEANGMDPKGITGVDNNLKMVMVGTSGEEYQTVDISNENSPTRCGGLNVDSGLYGVASVYNANGDAFSYVVSADTANELKIIKGGPGGGFGNGQGYAKTGDFTSSIFDSTSTSTWFSLTPSDNVPSNSTLKYQLRAGDTISALQSSTWSGPDGTSATYFSNSVSSDITSLFSGKRYLQYKAFFTSNSVTTPTINSIEINYQK